MKKLEKRLLTKQKELKELDKLRGKVVDLCKEYKFNKKVLNEF
jgi:hypothetical protein